MHVSPTALKSIFIRIEVEMQKYMNSLLALYQWEKQK